MTTEEQILLELQKLTAGIDAPGYAQIFGLDTNGIMILVYIIAFTILFR